MELILLFFLQLMLLLRETHSERCGVFGELREVKEGRKKLPEVCDHTGTGAGLEWYRLCNTGWDVDDAHVWCKQLGYLEAENKGKKLKKPGGDLIPKMTNVNCNTDTDFKLVDCPNIKLLTICDLVSDIKCRRCDRDTQCSNVGYCDRVSGTCKCSGDSTCGVGMECENEKCVESCASTCPEDSVCITVSGCVLVLSTIPTTTSTQAPTTTSTQALTTTSTQAPTTASTQGLTTAFATQARTTTIFVEESTTALTTKLAATTLVEGGISTNNSEVTLPQHNQTTESTQVTQQAPELNSNKQFRITFLQMIILGLTIIAMCVCIVITCIAVVSICYLTNMRQKRKKISIRENEYEEMAALPRCNFHEYYNNCSVSIPPYSPVQYDSVSEDNNSSTIRESILSESFVADDQMSYYSTMNNIPVSIEEPVCNSTGEDDMTGSGQMPYYSTVGEVVPVSIGEPARYYSTVGNETTQMPYYSTINDDDVTTNNTGGQMPYYSTVDEIVPVRVEEQASYYSVLGGEITVNDNEVYESIDEQFGYREYENINENNPIEPYLIT